MQKRIKAADLKPGDYVHTIKGVDVSATVTEVGPLPNETRTVGPRGGQYVLSQPMAAAGGVITGWSRVALSNGEALAVKDTMAAVIEGPVEW